MNEGARQAFDRSREAAARLDAEDSLAGLRRRFHLPRGASGEPKVYFTGNSLGLQPIDAESYVRRELEAWAREGVEAHFGGEGSWYGYHALLTEPLARLVGGTSEEVVAMNSLSVNLHLMMVSFYRPQGRRRKILMEDCAFPSDSYAVRTQIAYHGLKPDECLLVSRPEEGEGCDDRDLQRMIDEHGDEIALLLLGGVQYYSGRQFDLEGLTARAQSRGITVGLDLAHAVGNVPLALHDWGVDFAVWCSYKYLNGGPGAVAGCFVHERHARRTELPRFGGWWGNEPDRRFRMHLEPEFHPRPTAEGWQLSNPPILAMAPLRASLVLFDEASMGALRDKSLRLTAYLQQWVDDVAGERIDQLTPRIASSRGCQFSLRCRQRPRELFEALKRHDVVADFREPDVVRVAPVPMYNSFDDVWRFGQALAAWLDS